MRALVQRVTMAKVSANGQLLGTIGPGLVVFVGVANEDSEEDAVYLVNKIVNLRIFSDDSNKFNYSPLEINSQLMVVSQFTLHANTRKGRRPSFTDAASPEKAKPLFHKMVEMFINTGLDTVIGKFKEHMIVEIHNDGPVTIMLESSDIHRSRKT